MLLLIIGQLFHALWLMLSTRQYAKDVGNSGTARLLPLLVVIILLLSLAMGWLEPTRPY